MSNLKKNNMRFYLLVGERRNWEVSIKKKIWGFGEKTKGLWNTTNQGEFLAYYVTRPTKKIIGFGKVQEKFEDNSLIWQDEKLLGRSLWKYKIGIENFFVCNEWNKGISISKNIILRSSRGVLDKQSYLNLVKKADKTWNIELYDKIIENLKTQSNL